MKIEEMREAHGITQAQHEEKERASIQNLKNFLLDKSLEWPEPTVEELEERQQATIKNLLEFNENPVNIS